MFSAIHMHKEDVAFVTASSHPMPCNTMKSIREKEAR